MTRFYAVDDVNTMIVMKVVIMKVITGSNTVLTQPERLINVIPLSLYYYTHSHYSSN